MRSLAALTVLCLAASATLRAQATIDPGMSKAQVIAKLGPPSAQKNSGASTYLYYKNGMEKSFGMADLVVLDGDKVVDAVFRSSTRSYSGKSSSPSAIPADVARKGRGASGGTAPRTDSVAVRPPKTTAPATPARVKVAATPSKKTQATPSPKAAAAAARARTDSIRVAARADSVRMAARADSIRLAARADSVRAAARANSVRAAARADSAAARRVARVAAAHRRATDDSIARVAAKARVFATPPGKAQAKLSPEAAAAAAIEAQATADSLAVARTADSIAARRAARRAAARRAIEDSIAREAVAVTAAKRAQEELALAPVSFKIAGPERLTIGRGAFVERMYIVPHDKAQCTISLNARGVGGGGNRDVELFLANLDEFEPWVRRSSSRTTFKAERADSIGVIAKTTTPGVWYLVVSNRFSRFAGKVVEVSASADCRP